MRRIELLDVSNLILDGWLLIQGEIKMRRIELLDVSNLILDGWLLIPLFFEFIRIKGIFNLKK